MHINFLPVVLAGLIPTIVGFVWYHPKVMGTVWMEASGVNPDAPQKMNMGVIFGVSIVMSMLLAGSMLPIVIHQMGLNSMLMNEAGLNDSSSELGQVYNMFMTKYGMNFRTFKHGAFHGFLTALFLVLPIITTNALFEQKNAKYIGVNWAYWAICLTLMGGVVCAYA